MGQKNSKERKGERVPSHQAIFTGHEGTIYRNENNTHIFQPHLQTSTTLLETNNTVTDDDENNTVQNQSKILLIKPGKQHMQQGQVLYLSQKKWI